MGKVRKLLVRELIGIAVIGWMYATSAVAQQAPAEPLLKDVVLKSDTSTFSLSKHYLPYENEHYLFFRVNGAQEVWEITVYPENPQQVSSIRLKNSPDFTVVDSLTFLNDKYYRGRVRFTNLNEARTISLILELRRENIASNNGKGRPVSNAEIKLSPFFVTSVTTSPNESNVELFLEEEKSISLPTKNVFNIATAGENDWVLGDEFDYRVTRDLTNLNLQIRPHALGRQQLTLNLTTVRPFLDAYGRVTNKLPPVTVRFDTKPNRLNFVNSSQSVIFFDPGSENGQEIQLDNNASFDMRKTYRVEEQRESGGRLIAELFTVSPIANSNKILCRIRTYALHQASSGYLYIKDGDRTRFITNFSIVDRPRIDKISLMHEGRDWTTNTTVYPGENLEIKIEGTGLQNSAFQFDGATNVRADSARISDEAVFYRIKVPADISKRKITVFMNKRATQYEFSVREFQVPTDFDFITIDYGDATAALTDERLTKAVFYENTIRDITLTFDGNKIDEGNHLNGKQYMNIEVRVSGPRNELLDLQQINNIVACPGDKSPRYAYYNLDDCKRTVINLNDYLSRKTYNLEPYSQIQITVSHNESKQGSVGFSRRVKIFVKRRLDFDLQVSFPAGLLVKRFDQSGFGNFSGISTAIVAQLGFYSPSRLGQLRPYKLGAGFIALNAFNFNENANISRDIGIVALASISPIRANALVSIPIYVGGGYLLQQSAWFVLLGPGLRLSF